MQVNKQKNNVLIRIIPWLILFILCAIPLKAEYTDGGTIDYSAVLYRIRVWHCAVAAPDDLYLTGIDIFIFPFNWGVWDYEYSQRPIDAKVYIAPFIHW